MNNLFKVINMKLVSKKEYDINKEIDQCIICRDSLYTIPPDVFINSGTISVGVCNHVFHTCCINSWLKNKYMKNCPLCSEKWIVIKTVNIDIPTIQELKKND